MKFDTKEIIHCTLQLSYRDMLNIIGGGIASGNIKFKEKTNEYGESEEQETWINIKMETDAQNSLIFIKEYIKRREEQPPQ
jgi:hypothetical protein